MNVFKRFTVVVSLLSTLAMIIAGCSGGGSSSSGTGSGSGGSGGGGGNSPVTLNRVVSASNPLVGDWGSGVTSTSTLALSFYPNGTYIMWDNGAAGGTGIEYGTYSTVASGNTVTLTVTSILDDQGDNPANPINASGITEYSGQTKTIPVTIVDSNTVQVVDSSGGTVTLHRVVDASNPIVGSWGDGVTNGGSTPNSVLLVVFYANGTYILYGNDSNATCYPGAEYGTYSYNAATSTLTATATVDRNGDQGLANGNGTGGTWWAKVNGDVFNIGDSAPAPVTISGFASMNTTGTAIHLAGMLITARHTADIDNSNPIAQATTAADGSFTMTVPYGSDLYLNISGSTGGTQYAPFNTRIWRNVTQAPDLSTYAIDAINSVPLTDINNMLNSLACGPSPCSTSGISGKGWLALDAFDAGYNNKIDGVSYSLSPSVDFFGYNDDSNGSTYVAPPAKTATSAETISMNGPSALASNASAAVVTVTISKSGSASQIVELPLVPGELTYKQVGY